MMRLPPTTRSKTDPSCATCPLDTYAHDSYTISTQPAAVRVEQSPIPILNYRFCVRCQWALSRRGVLGVLTSGGLGALVGCTTVLGSPKTDPTAESAPASGTDAPVERTSEGAPVTSAAPSLGSSPGSEDETRDTAQDQIIEEPVESPATNERPYADPDDRLVLTNVTLAVSEPFRRDSFRQLDGTISIDIEGKHFTATGRGHVEWECDGVQFKTVVVDGRDARVYLETTEVDSCWRSENKVGRGPWSVSFTITGQFVGGRPDSLQVSIQGPFVKNAGVFVTEAL